MPREAPASPKITKIEELANAFWEERGCPIEWKTGFELEKTNGRATGKGRF
jgi:hypothetical protein